MTNPKLERVAERPAAGRKLDINTWAMGGVLVAMWALLALLPATRGMFLTQGNVTNLLSQCSVLLVVSIGMTFVILIRGIDLSVGAGVALTGVVAALAQDRLGLSAPWAILITLAAGAAIGAWHGFWVGWLGIPAFIVTLAGFKAYRGGALVASDATSLQMGDDFACINGTIPVAATWTIVLVVLAIGVVTVWNEARRREAAGLPGLTTTTVALRIAGQVLLAGAVLAVFGSRGVPVPVLIAGSVAVAGVFALRRTRLGREVYAIGGNPEAARLSGIDVKRVTMIVYIVMGVLTALAGLLAAGRINSVTASNQGYLLELDAVTAVVIGGTSIAGGRGTVTGTVLGTLVFATLANGMSLLGIDSNWQLIFTGGILLLAVLIDVVLKGRKSNKLVLGLLFALPLIPMAVIGFGRNAKSEAKRPDVAFLLATLQEERYQKDLKYFDLRAAELGLVSATFSADNDGAKQLSQVEDALTLGAKVLVIQPTDSKAAATYVQLAHRRGAKVVAYDRSIVSRELDYYVSHDSYRVGVLQAEAAIRHTGGKGKFVLLSGQAGHSVAAEITRGYRDTLAPFVARADIDIVMEQSHSAWSAEQALRTVEDALTRTGGRVDAILANNSGMARGAVKAIENARLEHVFIAGADADAANVNFVCSGQQTIEILKDIQPLAATAAEVAKAILSGTPANTAGTIALDGGQVPVVAVRVEVITPANAKSLVDSGFVSASEVPACKQGGAQ
ncbi:MAG: substrate-binding domain-containing protein [Deltaproteobacteria bacterium]|nr:substrate-binding domain-containing protein [Deltaproteobacteria bacterium]